MRRRIESVASMDLRTGPILAHTLATAKEAVAEIKRLRAALTESYQDNLYSALHSGVTGNGGKWWPGGMSDAEWFCRQAGIEPKPESTKDALMARVPAIAAQMVAAHQQTSEKS